MNVENSALVPSNEQSVASAKSASLVAAPSTTGLPQEIHRTKLRDFLRGQVGKFVGLDFAKVDGTSRSLNGRLGVRKHLKGGHNNLAGSAQPYLVMYDVKTPGYRAVNLATVGQVRANRKCWTVVG